MNNNDDAQYDVCALIDHMRASNLHMNVRDIARELHNMIDTYVDDIERVNAS